MLLDLHKNYDFSNEKLRFWMDYVNKFDPEEKNKVFEVLAEQAIKNQEFPIAQNLILRIDRFDLVTKLFDQWIPLGNPNEAELFIIRYLLLYILFRLIIKKNRIKRY